MIKQLFLTSALTLLSFPSLAATVSGVELNEKITVNEQFLTLNGAGVRSKFFIDLYVGSLYLTEHSKDSVAIISANKSMMVQLDITSSMITSDRMVEAIEEGFHQGQQKQDESLQAEITQFIAIFNEPIKLEDKFQLLYLPNNSLVILKNGDLIKTQPISFEFKKALFSIWLGDKPAQKSLKRAMLTH